MAVLVAAIGNFLAGIGGGLTVNTTTMANLGYGGKSALLAGLGTVMDPVFSVTTGIGPVLIALGSYLANPGDLVTALLGLL